VGTFQKKRLDFINSKANASKTLKFWLAKPDSESSGSSKSENSPI
jgi:hypothetical protein